MAALRAPMTFCDKNDDEGDGDADDDADDVDDAGAEPVAPAFCSYPGVAGVAIKLPSSKRARP